MKMRADPMTRHKYVKKFKFARIMLWMPVMITMIPIIDSKVVSSL